MAIIALVSGKGSNGVTTSALAFTLTWSRPIVLAECDPAGGDVVAGFLRHLELDGNRGLMQLVVAGLRGHAADQFWAQLIDLDPPSRQRLLLPGIVAPAQAASLDPSWHQLGGFFSSLERCPPGFDVVVDCGRLVAPHAPWALLNRADLVLLVVRPVLPSLVSARAAIDTITACGGPAVGALPGAGGRLGLLAVGDGDYDDREISRHLSTPVIVHLPRDDRTAQALTRGGTVHARRPLLRAAAAAEGGVMHAITRRREFLRGARQRAATGREETAHVGL